MATDDQRSEIVRCDLCELHKTCHSVKIDPQGNGDIVFLGEAPGEDEDRKGIPFVGAAGKFLRNFISEIEIDPARIRFTNAVRCRPPQNRTPKPKELKACLTHLIDEFCENPPTHIVALGNSALDALRKADLLHIPGTIMNLHGKAIEDNGLIIFPMLHPAYILRNTDAIQLYIDAFNEFEKVVNEGIKEPAKVEYEFSSSVDELREAIKEAKKAGKVAYDIETSLLHPTETDHEPEIMCFSLTWRERQAFGFVLEDENREEALDVLHTELLEDPSVKKIIQHAKFEITWSNWLGRDIVNIDDTMLLHWHIDERKGTHGLGKLAAGYTDMGFYDAELENYKKEHKEADPDKFYKDPDTKEKKKGSYKNIPLEILLPYNCADTDAAFRVHKLIRPQLSAKQLWIHDNIQIPACYPLADMELRGVPLDWDYVHEFDEKLRADIAKKTAELFAYPEVQELDEIVKGEGKFYIDPATDEEVSGLNFNSTEQVSRLLFQFIGMRSVYSTKAGKPSTDKHVLEYLAQKHPIPKLILERRQIATNHSTFVVGALEERRGNFLHTSYKMVGTDTGRYSSSNPNLQNIPRDERFRNMFIPDPGHWMVQIDYSQVELRVMALFSADKKLLEYFAKGYDVHLMIAAQIQGCAPEDVTKEERTKAKRTVFGLCYGQGPSGLASELGITEYEAESFLEKFFAEFPGVRKWMRGTEKKVIETGQVETMFGRIRRLPNAKIPRKDDFRRLEALRQAINAPIQGTATDILAMKKAALYEWMKTEGLQSRMLLTVHDSILFSMHPDEVNLLIPAAKMIMEDFSDIDWIKIPILVDVEIGHRWGELRKLTNEDITAFEEGADIEEIYKLRAPKKAA